jgi:hypothetical protein
MGSAASIVITLTDDIEPDIFVNVVICKTTDESPQIVYPIVNTSNSVTSPGTPKPLSISIVDDTVPPGISWVLTISGTANPIVISNPTFSGTGNLVQIFNQTSYTVNVTAAQPNSIMLSIPSGEIGSYAVYLNGVIN